jgi:hypothetical protein
MKAKGIQGMRAAQATAHVCMRSESITQATERQFDASRVRQEGPWECHIRILQQPSGRLALAAAKCETKNTAAVCLTAVIQSAT